MKTSWPVILLFMVGIVTNRGACQGDGVPSVEYLTREANAIVVGRATLEKVSVNSATVTIEVDRVIQGQITPDTQIEVGVVNASSSCTIPSSANPVTAIWFLSQKPDGTFSFAKSPKSQSCHPFDSNYETADGPLPAQWAYPETAKPEDKLAYELAWAIESHPGINSAAVAIKSDNLDGVSKESKADLYRKLYSSSAADAHFTGLLGLVKQGDANALVEVTNNMTQFAQTPITTSYAVNGQITSVAIKDENGAAATQIGPIAISIDQIVDPDAATVDALGNLLQMQNSPQSIRHAAAHALANIHSGAAVTYLAPLLNSDDAVLRTDAIGGIACFANGVPAINPSKPDGRVDLNKNSPFKTDATLSHFAMGATTISQKEAYYLNYWRGWWSANGAAVQALPSGS